MVIDLPSRTASKSGHLHKGSCWGSLFTARIAHLHRGSLRSPPSSGLCRRWRRSPPSPWHRSPAHLWKGKCRIGNIHNSGRPPSWAECKAVCRRGESKQEKAQIRPTSQNCWGHTHAQDPPRCWGKSRGKKDDLIPAIQEERWSKAWWSILLISDKAGDPYASPGVPHRCTRPEDVYLSADKNSQTL